MFRGIVIRRYVKILPRTPPGATHGPLVRFARFVQELGGGPHGFLFVAPRACDALCITRRDGDLGLEEQHLGILCHSYISNHTAIQY